MCPHKDPAFRTFGRKNQGKKWPGTHRLPSGQRERLRRSTCCCSGTPLRLDIFTLHSRICVNVVQRCGQQPAATPRRLKKMFAKILALLLESTLLESQWVIFSAFAVAIILPIAIGRIILFRGETSGGWWFSDHLSCRCIIKFLTWIYPLQF